jgi:outer membrane protein insertion porin family/translocation and assembly module TamA
MRRTLRPALAALAAAAALLAAAPEAPGQRYAGEEEVRSLQFLGNAAFSDDELASAIATESTRCKTPILFPLCAFTDWGIAHERAYLDPDRLDADALRLLLYYRRRGYRAVQVDTAVASSNGGVDVTFRIEEGRPVRIDSLAVPGASGLVAEGRLSELLTVREGSPLDLTELERSEDRIVEHLQNRGYARAVVLREYFIPAGSRRAEVTLQVEPGPRVRFGEITVMGNEKVSDDVIRRFLTLSPGGLYRYEAILESQRNLYAMEALRYANIETSYPAGTDTLLDVTVDVTEAPLNSVRAGIGVTTTDCGQGEVAYVHRNFLGGARRLELTWNLSNVLAEQVGGRFPCTDVGPTPVFRDLDFQAVAEFRQPNFFSTRNRLRASVFVGRETVPNIFVRTSRGGEVGLTRRLRARMPISLTYRPELTDFDEASADVFFCVNFGFCDPSDIATVTEARWLAPLTLSWSYDRTNATFSPTAGHYMNAELETAGGYTGSDYGYNRAVFDAASFEEIASNLVLAVHLRLGVLDPTGAGGFAESPGEGTVVHPRKRFFAGGPQSVRGFGQNLLGPTVLVVDAAEECPGVPLEACVAGLDPPSFQERPAGGNALLESSFELRWRVTPDWEAVAFLDVGRVASELGSLEAPVATPGMGIRFFSPVGPFRVDVGYDPTGAQSLPVVAQLEGGREIRDLDVRVDHRPYTWDAPGSLQEFFRRLQLHLSIGEAF